MGNRTSTVIDGTSTLYTPDSTNAYTAVSGQVWNDDLSGNVLTDGLRSYGWDVHNRLISVTTGGQEVGRYTYDALGRRISRRATLQGQTTRHRYVYDGWNVVAEFTSPATGPEAPTLARRYVWGNDLSGSRQGAGGVGGLLLIEDRTTSPLRTYYPHHDANGNITTLTTQSANGTLIPAATYLYDPWGNLRSATGPYAAQNPIRFSSKFTDDESGLVYYGYRYYKPEQGWWLSRDPIWERGGVNVMAMRCSSGNGSRTFTVTYRGAPLRTTYEGQNRATKITVTWEFECKKIDGKCTTVKPLKTKQALSK
jgi:RHS repeat-associated protein